MDYYGRMHVVPSTKMVAYKWLSFARIRPPSSLYFLYFLL